MLDCRIQGQVNVVARRNVQTLDPLDKDSPAKRVAFSNRRSCFAADKIVVPELDSLEPFRITADKADHLAAQLTLGIMAGWFIKHTHSLGIERLYLFRLRVRHLSSDHGEKLRRSTF